MSAKGFSRVRVGLFGVLRPTSRSLGWTRPSTQGHLTLWFQADERGWDAAWGSRFTLQFQLASEASSVLEPGGRFERIGYLLEGLDELDALRERNNLVIRQLPGTRNNQVKRQRMPDGSGCIVEGYVVEPDRSVYGFDIWLHYYSAEDVQAWARYFQERLLRFVDLFEQEIRSDQAQARLRFNEAMAVVQRTADRNEKSEILRRFVASESDPHFKACASHWLDVLRDA